MTEETPQETPPASLTREFSVGRVLANSFSTLNSNLPSFGLLALILMIPNAYFIIAPLGGSPVTLGDISNPLAIAGVTMVLQVVFGSLLSAMLIYGTFESMKGHKVNIGDLISKGLAVVFPVVGLAIIIGFIIALGMILLIVPGVILAIMFYVAIPVRVVEGRNIGDCLSRSEKLTKGHRWSIFGLLVLVVIISTLINAVAGGLMAIIGNLPLMGTILYIVSAYITAFGSVISAMVYYELRAAKEGVDIDELSQVFA
ncbi:hypothetical protein [Paremcibacter congregatus]|uniref:hypothetical protein n=1 Tax=Paremcibacter congregatus TaxID=2043170 RepID=UPI0030EEF97E|tara:strand:+ start:5332 stop:6102 length:771 start_codon:yes stop_codon:yes gene_type:complete